MNETLLSVTGFEHRVLETLEESPFGGLYARETEKYRLECDRLEGCLRESCGD